ncbi:putative O-methyltransferase [Polynucleobacter duraquae]|uniref:O-methyltransferase n=1 Tax=Polynucleobacter duraquae TaxID=1835254 RepID=A0A0E3V0D8_9BURK|nr:methyltransferase domain-containing protein [Polynucleobacter duraquae]AKD25194.1 putative O-methyltransferase [Polynucleobacter duraquae]
MKHFKVWLTIFSTFYALNTYAQSVLEGGDDQYKPQVGQEGKDVIWVPTTNELLAIMLKTAKVNSNDLVYDLGSGDGRIAIAAAKDFGAQAVGIEFNPAMAELAQRNVNRAGVGERVKIINGDIFKEDFSKATVVTMYLLPDLNIALRPTILKMKPGTRVTSHAFNMGDWDADIEIDSPAKAFYWVVPAPVEGEWLISGMEPKRTVLKLSQHYQKIGGTLQIGDDSQPLLNPRLDGATLSFTYLDRNKASHFVIMAVDKNAIKGIYKSRAFNDNVIVGKRL